MRRPLRLQSPQHLSMLYTQIEKSWPISLHLAMLALSRFSFAWHHQGQSFIALLARNARRCSRFRAHISSGFRRGVRGHLRLRHNRKWRRLEKQRISQDCCQRTVHVFRKWKRAQACENARTTNLSGGGCNGVTWVMVLSLLWESLSGLFYKEM